MSDKRKDGDREKSLSGNAFTRGARMASLPASYAARTTWGLGKRMVGAPAHAVMSDVQRRTADQIFSVLGQLKGGAMKFGQAMSVFEAALPEEFAGPYRQALTKLQDAAPPMPTATVHRVMAQEFGENWRDFFPEFDEAPAAAASIGQVHHGWWRSDLDSEPIEVAIKLQYPGAGKALEADLRQIGRIARLFGVFAPNLDIKSLVAELQERVVEELDYGLEAASQNAFAEAFAADPDIVIPHSVMHTERALVSTWLASERSLADVIRDGTAEERDHYGEIMVRFLFAGPSTVGMLHADPHPGNFRILTDGRLGVVDYGAVARMPDGLPRSIGPLIRAGINDEWHVVVDGLRNEGFLGNQDIDVDALSSYLRPLIEPAMTETFTFSREWLRAQGERISKPTADGLGTARQISVPREYLMIERVWMGGVGILCQLGATAPFREILLDSLPGFADQTEH